MVSWSTILLLTYRPETLYIYWNNYMVLNDWKYTVKNVWCQAFFFFLQKRRKLANMIWNKSATFAFRSSPPFFLLAFSIFAFLFLRKWDLRAHRTQKKKLNLFVGPFPLKWLQILLDSFSKNHGMHCIYYSFYILFHSLFGLDLILRLIFHNKLAFSWGLLL